MLRWGRASANAGIAFVDTATGESVTVRSNGQSGVEVVKDGGATFCGGACSVTSNGLVATIKVRVQSRSIPPPWGSIRCRLAPRTYAPWGVRVVSQTESRKIPTRNILPLFLSREQDKKANAAASKRVVDNVHKLFGSMEAVKSWTDVLLTIADRPDLRPRGAATPEQREEL